MAADTLKVLYIVGWGRSGSTLLAEMLGQLDGITSTGELAFLWRRGYVDGRRCGCGEPLPECSYWRAVADAAAAAAGGVLPSPEAVTQWQEDDVRVRHVPRLLRATAERARDDPAVGGYMRALGAMYRGIADVTGARVIVDSSKRPADAAVARLLPGLAVRYLHMVRDPRAVAWSYRRRKPQPDRGPGQYLTRHGTATSTAQWLAWNIAAEALQRRHGTAHGMLLRYEDFMESPAECFREVVDFVDESATGGPFVAPRRVHLAPNHTVSGNPNRFVQGFVDIRPDEEWRRLQATRHRALASLIACPLLGRYRYPLFPPPSSAPDTARGGRTMVARRFMRTALRNPPEALSRIQSKIEVRQAGRIPRSASYEPTPDWQRVLHERIGAPWPCPETERFSAAWATITGELGEDLYTQDIAHDADPRLACVAWCLTRHLEAQRVIETGVARGLTSRVILEALDEATSAGHLWSIDLPPLSDPWNRLVGTAVPDRLHSAWSYRRGASRRLLPGLLADVGPIDLFVHDSLHTPQTMTFEFEHAWDSLRPGGALLADDIGGNDAFAELAACVDGLPPLVIAHERKAEMVGVLVRPRDP